MKNYYIVKDICRKMYLAGVGDFWFKKGEIGNAESLRYKLMCGILFFFYFLMTGLEVMSAIWGDLPKDEKSDNITLAVSHAILQTKMLSVMAKRERVKEFNRVIVEICKHHEDEGRLASNHSIMKMNVVAYLLGVYGATFFYIFEGIRKMFAGNHFIVIVTYWPYYDDNSIPAISFRVFNTGVLLAMMATMISVDSFAVISMIMYKYKIVTLRRYFENLRMKFDENIIKGNEQYAGDQLYAGLIEGIIMHAKLIRLKKELDCSFGVLIAAQGIQSSGSAVSLLLQLALSKDISFGAALKIILFIVALFFLLALFLCNAGEIKYQASLLSDSIFYCGWHATPMRKDLRQLVLIAVMAAQRPIVMKAFNMLELTYATFIQVVRSTYSVFALFYAKNK